MLRDFRVKSPSRLAGLAGLFALAGVLGGGVVLNALPASSALQNAALARAATGQTCSSSPKPPSTPLPAGSAIMSAAGGGGHASVSASSTAGLTVCDTPPPPPVSLPAPPAGPPTILPSPPSGSTCSFSPKPPSTPLPAGSAIMSAAGGGGHASVSASSTAGLAVCDTPPAMPAVPAGL